MAQLSRLRAPLSNIYVLYALDLPFQDKRLYSLRSDLQTIAQSYAKVFKGERYSSPPIPVEDLLGGLAYNDPTNGFLRSLDLEIEMYRPPFPPQPYFTNRNGNGGFSPAKRDPDFWIETDWLDSLPHTLPVTTFSTTTMPPSSSFFVSFIAQGSTISQVTTGSAFLKPLTGRSGRLDSLADLAGSVILIHLQPGINAGMDPDLLSHVRLLSLTLSIDNATYTVRIQRLRTGVSPLFRWYELRIPVGMDFRSYLEQD